MSLNISDYYKSILNSKLNGISNTSNVGNLLNASDSTSSKSTSTDKVDLNSSASNASGFLNYNATGSYNSLPSLADFLDTSSDNNLSDVLNTDGTNNSNQMSSLADLLNQDSSTDGSSSDSVDSMFSSLAQDNTMYNNFLIQQALNKMSSSVNQPSASTVKKEDTTDKTIK